MANVNPLTLVIADRKTTELLPDTDRTVVISANADIKPMLMLAHPDMTNIWVAINGIVKPSILATKDGVCLVALPYAAGTYKVQLSHGLWQSQKIPGISFTLQVGTTQPVPEPTDNSISVTATTWSVCSLSVADLIDDNLDAVPPTVIWTIPNADPNVMKNSVFYGFVHNHLFTKAGNYTVTATIIWPDGRKQVQPFAVNVSENTEHTSQRVYVSSSEGNDSNDGTQDKPMRTLAAAINTGKYVFLKRGDVFFFDQSLRVPRGLDYYGSGSLNAPVLSWKGTHHENTWVINLIYLLANAYVRGLSITTPFDYTPAKTQAEFKYQHDLTPRVFICSKNNAVIDCTAHNIGDFCNMNNSPSNCLFVGNSVDETIRCYMFWVQGDNHCFYYNNCTDSIYEHASRFSGYNWVSTNYNIWGNKDKRGTQDAQGVWSGDKDNTGKGVQTRQKGVGHYGAFNSLYGPAGIGPLGRGNGVDDPSARTRFVVSHSETIFEVSNNPDTALTTPLEIWHGTTGFRIMGTTGPRLSFENTELNLGYPADRIISNGLITGCRFSRIGKLTTGQGVTIDAETSANAKAVD